MDLVLCHTTADFDTLGAAVGVSRLRPGSRIVLTGGTHPTVHDFLALWQDEYPLIDRRAVAFETVRSLTLVDASARDRFLPVSDWFDQARERGLPIYIYDHHRALEASAPETSVSEIPEASSENFPGFPGAEVHREAVGAVTTLIAEALQQQKILLTSFEATVMALGIHSDTGSLTFEQSTDRDAHALAWLMSQGAHQSVIAETTAPGLSLRLQDLLTVALKSVEVEQVRGHQLGWVQLATQNFVPGLSGLAERLISLLGLDTLLLYSSYRADGAHSGSAHSGSAHSDGAHSGSAVVIGRSRTNSLLPNSTIDLRPIFQQLGGGGHAQAASVVLKGNASEVVFEEMLTAVRSQLPQPIMAKVLMSSPVRTILPTTSVDEAQQTLLRYGHVGLCVVDSEGLLVGMISRRDIDIALRHGLGHSPVKGCMSVDIKSTGPETTIKDIQALMMTYDVGRLPVLEKGSLIGIVTRTDLLRELHQQSMKGSRQKPDACSPSQQAYLSDSVPQLGTLQTEPLSVPSADADAAVKTFASNDFRLPSSTVLYEQFKGRIGQIWPAVALIAAAAERRGWALYVVGGAVRDLLLGLSGEPYTLTDIDLVVEGAGEGAGVALAESIQASYPQVSVQVHGQFQTASLVWHPAEPDSDAADSEAENSETENSKAENWSAHQPILIDIATARTEFYPYPAANPEVEASTIRQDLYRRDFTINAMALRLNGSEPGQLLDFFGGWLDLQKRHVRVLHANSFIEDPTRIFRAVKFALRLDFSIDAQSERFIHYAVSSGIYEQMQASDHKTPALQARLKAELKYVLSARHWAAAILQLDRLGAWACLHSSLVITPALGKQLSRMDRWLNKFDVAQPRWLMLLELMIAQLAPDLRKRVAINLDLDAKSLHRLQHLPQWESNLAKQLPKAKANSQVYRLLNSYDPPELLLIADRHPYTIGPQIWQYIVRLSQMPPLINGDTLKRLGYQPGPQFRNILTAVHFAVLDGSLTTKQAAEAYVRAHYPLE